MQPSTIKLFLANGSPNGLRTAEISNWTGKAVDYPRSESQDFLVREEAGNSGVYFLSGVEAETGEHVIYVGEAEHTGKRVRQHRDKDFWNNGVIFTSKDKSLTKAHTKYLEGRLIERAAHLGKAKLLNVQAGGSHLPESDLAEMEVFRGKIYQLLPILGIDAFTEAETVSGSEATHYFCRIKGLTAEGRRTSNGFMVFKGSEAVLSHRPSAKWPRSKAEIEAKSSGY